MKNRVSMILLVLFLILQVSFAQNSFAKVEFNKELFNKLIQNKNKVPKIEIPKYKRIELNNGMIIYLVEDHKLPVIELTGYIRGGVRQETKDVAGISDFMFEMMNTGTKNFSEQEFSKYKGLHGIDFSFSSQRDYFNFSGNALSVDQEKLLSLVADIFKNPKFNTKYFYRIKQETLRALSQAKTQERSLLNMYFNKHLYQEHPYSFNSNINLRKEALNNITPQKISQFYTQNIAPNNIILGIVGDIDLDNMKQMVKKYFGDWSKKEIKIKTPEVKIDTTNYGKVILVNKSDATQAKIKMGYNFFKNEFKDRIAFSIANRVYGGGDFKSRLMEDLRTNKGYVYSVYSRDIYNQLGGVYYISTEVKPNKTDETIIAIKEEMLTIKEGKEQITEDELFEIVNLYNAFLPKSYSSKVNILNEIIYNVELRNKDPHYINQFIRKYNHLQAKKVQKVFSKYTYPERFLTVIVGNKDKILPELKEQGIGVEIIEGY